MKLAVLFPGQGSQYLGMGSEFIQESEQSRELLQIAENVSGLPLEKLMNDGPMEDLTRNANLQPAITLTNIICWEALRQKLADIKVSCFAGHSLGEYSALYASGVVGAEDCIRLVAKRGALMEREGEANPGGMRAVLGLGYPGIKKILDGYGGEGVVTAANHNTPLQVVLSGSISGLDGVNADIEASGGKVIPLNVSVANHSPLVANAVPDFTKFMSGIEFRTPKTPVYFNVSGEVCTDVKEIKDMMARQIASRVKWCDIVTAMIEDGVDTFIEVGPKTVLKGMMRKIAPKGVKVLSMQCDTPKSLSACLEKLG